MSSLRNSALDNVLLILLLSSTSVWIVDVLIGMGLIQRITGLLAAIVVCSVVIWLNDLRTRAARLRE